jgi:hypothetical protein
MSAKNAVTPVEIILFGPGGAELGMTCFEILQMMETYSAYLGTAVETYLTILFGYLVAMHLAGTKLSRVQYAIANTLFLVVMASYVIFFIGLLWSVTNGIFLTAPTDPRSQACTAR